MKVDREILAELSPRNLVLAYSHGAFPMVQEGELAWFCPDPRGLMPLDERFHVSRRLAWTIRAGRFVCTVDRRFPDIVQLCARWDDPEITWISPEIYTAYRKLHELGLAHSVEVWPADQVEQGLPVGGLYGVTIGGAFFAESMFHTATDAGKVGVAFLVERLRQQGFTICDIQWTTPNLRRFGAYDVPRGEYLAELTSALSLKRRFA